MWFGLGERGEKDVRLDTILHVYEFMWWRELGIVLCTKPAS